MPSERLPRPPQAQAYGGSLWLQALHRRVIIPPGPHPRHPTEPTHHSDHQSHMLSSTPYLYEYERTIYMGMAFYVSGQVISIQVFHVSVFP